MTTNTESTTPTTSATRLPEVAFPQVTWFEVHTTKPSEAAEFYGGLFGWTFDDTGAGYLLINQGEGQVTGGGIADTGGQWPSTVIPCVQVDDVPATAARVGDLGGSVLAEPTVTPNGIGFAYLADREGSAFGIWTPPAQS